MLGLGSGPQLDREEGGSHQRSPSAPALVASLASLLASVGALLSVGCSLYRRRGFRLVRALLGRPNVDAQKQRQRDCRSARQIRARLGLDLAFAHVHPISHQEGQTEPIANPADPPLYR